MDARELKGLIQSSPALPALSQAAWEAVRMREDNPDLTELSAILSFDRGLSERVRQEARQVSGRRIEDIEDALNALGPAAARATVLRHALTALFPPARLRRLDRNMFWRNAFSSAAIAERLAERAQIAQRWDAYPAGLLHDLGQLAIDAVIEPGYSKALETAHNQGLFVLESERQEFGVDHTLAGKWLAERWGLPGPLVSAIWLHHHPPGALDQTVYPVPLIDTVALASTLGRRRGEERTAGGEGYVEERMHRLGLPMDSLEQFSPRRMPVHPLRSDADTALETSAVPDAAQDRVRAAERRARHYRALYEATVAFSGARDVAQVLRQTAAALREGLRIRSGLCYSIDAEQNRADAALWRADSEEIAAIAFALDGTQEQAGLRFLQLLSELETGAAHPAGAPLPEVIRRQGLVAIPVSAGERNLGQILFDARRAGFHPSPEDMPLLLSFANACAGALMACQAREELSGQTESLGEALWQREMAQQKHRRGERLASVARMAAGAAHEINNPLAIISGRAQILLNRVSDTADAQALQVIVDQSRRAGKVLNDLLQFARPAAPRLLAARIDDVLRRVMAALKDRLQSEGIVVREYFAADLPEAIVDRQQMEQVFINLILNAEEAMAPSGGTLTLTAKPGRDRKTAVVQIADTGHGIPGDIVSEVFEPFFTTRETGAHTGLGLSVCHGILENHRGTIAIHSKPGQETVVTVTLPAAAKAAQEVPAEDRRELPLVLLADAGQDLCEILTAALQTRGYRVRATGDALEAMAAIIAHPVRAVLVDTSMNALDGSPLWHRIRQRHPDVPLIAMAPRPDKDEEDSARALGVAAFLHKPFGIDALVTGLRSVLGTRDVA